MANLQDLLAASQVGARAANAISPTAPADDGDLMSTLRSVGDVGLGAVASVGNFLDLPGSTLRDLLAGKGLAGSFDQWMTPLSDVNRTTGRQLLEDKMGMRKNKETGITGWLSDPGEGLRDLAGFAAEVALDPFGPLTKPLMAGTALGRAATSAASRAHPLMRALGRGTVNVFDTLPADLTSKLVTTPYRGLKALFNPASRGVTDHMIQDMADQVSPIIEKIRVKSVSHAAEIAITARRVGFNLVADEGLNAADPATWMRDDSLLRVNAREDAMYKYLELGDDHNPAAGELMSRDIVTVGEGGDMKEVEYVNRTDRGAQVKLVGDETLYSDTQLKPSFMQQRVAIPQELKNTLDVIRGDVDAMQLEAQELGIKLGDDVDTYGRYWNRTKSNELRQIEAVAGMDQSSWRKSFNSLVASLISPGGRDIMYKGFRDKTAGVNELFADKFMQDIVKRIDDMSVESVNMIEGVHPKIILDHIGIRHLEPLANALGITPEELWKEIDFNPRKVQKTGAYVSSTDIAQHDIIEGGSRIGQVGLSIQEDGGVKSAALDLSQISVLDAERGVLEDVLPSIEKAGRAEGVSRFEVVTTPEMGDSFWKNQGYSADGVLDGGRERWGKDVYPGMDATDPSLNAPVMMEVEDLKTYMGNLRRTHQFEVDEGLREGIQPRRGHWSRWDNVSDGGRSSYTYTTKDLTLREVDFSQPLRPSDFHHTLDYDNALAFHEKGRKVFIGTRAAKKGYPAVNILVSPMQRAKLDTVWDKFEKNLADTIKADPLTQKEAIYDHLHQAITRNYGERIDQWMPEISTTTVGGKQLGMVHAVVAQGKTNAPLHSETPTGWRKLFPDLHQRIEEGKNLTAPMQALLRLNDESLQALSFSKQNIETMKSLRDKYNGGIEAKNAKTLDDLDVIKDPMEYMTARDENIESALTQDAGVGLVDRHRALAQEMGDHVEKRVAPVFSRSAAVAGYDYLNKNGSAIALVRATHQKLKDFFFLSQKETGGKGVAGDLLVTRNMDPEIGMTLGDALEGETGMFAGKVDSNVFLENMRKDFVESGKTDPNFSSFVETEDPAAILGQIERIKGIQASSDIFTQMRTLNEIQGAADLPEMGWINRLGASFMAWHKSGALAYTPATAIRDGFSSFVNAIIIGGMNAITALARYGRAAMSFLKGSPVDPGEGIEEIEAFLKVYGRESTPATRGEAFQNLWNAHHQGGSMHPNIIEADTAAMEGADSTTRLVADVPNFAQKTMGQQFKGNFKGSLNPLKSDGALNPLNVAGAWTKDATGRPVRRSTSNVAVTLMNGFRHKVDMFNRALYVLDRVGKTKSLADAFAMSDKVLMNANPRNFTRFEHKYMKAIVPFYSFMRQSIPMFMQELMINPGGGLGMTVRATRLGQGDEKGYVPFQYQDTAAIPIGKGDDGSLKYLTSLGLMHEDAVNYAGNILQGDVRGGLQKAISSASPAMKWIIEYSTNTSLYSQGPMGGRRLDDLDPSLGRLLTNLGVQPLGPSGRATPVGGPMGESLLSASPVSRLLSIARIASTDSARSGGVEKVMRLLSGVKVEHVSPEQITRDIRDRLNALQIKAGARPLTTVAGTAGLMDRMIERGDVEGAAQLQQINKVLTALRKQVGESGATRSKDKRPTTQALIDRLRASR